MTLGVELNSHISSATKRLQ